MQALTRVSLHLAAMTRKVLLIDPDPSSQQQSARVLRDCRCEVNIVDSASAAVAQLGSSRFDAAVVDFRLATQSGVDVPAVARRAHPGINIILTVESIGNTPAHQPLRLHGYPLLTKPLRIEELV
jgi:DNA-binding NtrC family response regulator